MARKKRMPESIEPLLPYAKNISKKTIGMDLIYRVFPVSILKEEDIQFEWGGEL